MVWFNVLVIKEHVEGTRNKFDHNICILYDSISGYYYYYGLRSGSPGEYSGVYSYDQKSSFLDFLGYLMADFQPRFTTELHQLDIHPDEYDCLSYRNIYTRLNNSNRAAVNSSTKLQVTDLNEAPQRGADSNLYWYKKTSANTLLAAYDANEESRISISDYLNMLVFE